MSSLRNTKQQTIDLLVKHYGDNWKTPLSRDLGVNVSTIRRIFNQREEIPLVYQTAIDSLITSAGEKT